jgi:hypothetical protein
VAARTERHVGVGVHSSAIIPAGSSATAAASTNRIPSGEPRAEQGLGAEIEAYERDLALKSRELFRRFSGPSCKLCGSCLPRQRALAAQVSLLRLRQDITEDEPRPPNDFTDLDPDGAREDRPLEHKRVELAVFAARVHAFR